MNKMIAECQWEPTIYICFQHVRIDLTEPIEAEAKDEYDQLNSKFTRQCGEKFKWLNKQYTQNITTRGYIKFAEVATRFSAQE